MKWIGQHIWDFVSRFRNDVYLEDIADGTVASDKFLGLDSNNKIVKEAVSSGGIAFDGSTANGVLTYKNADEATVESTLLYDGNTLEVGSAAGSGKDAKFYTAGTAAHIGIHWDADYETEGGLIGGANNHGVDFKFFGETNGAFCEWDMSNDRFTVVGDTKIQAGQLIQDGNRDFTPTTDGRALHIDTFTATDTNTSSSGTAAHYRNFVIEAPTVDSTNASVTTTNATNVYIKDAPIKGTNQTLTNAYALWVDDGVTRLDGNVIALGTIDLGNASDTTIARSSAGVVTIEGSTVVTNGASGTNIVVLDCHSAYLSTITAATWFFGNNAYGFGHHIWNNVSHGIESDSSTFTMSEDHNIVGRLVPVALAKVSLKVSARPADGGTGNSTGETVNACIISADANAAGTNTTWTVLAQGAASQVQGEYDSITCSYTGSIADTKMLAVGIGSAESSGVGTTNIRFTYTLTGYIA